MAGIVEKQYKGAIVMDETIEKQAKVVIRQELPQNYTEITQSRVVLSNIIASIGSSLEKGQSTSGQTVGGDTLEKAT